MDWATVLGLTVVGALVTTAGTLLGLFLKEVLLARSFERWKMKQALAQVSRRYREPIALSAIELCNRLTFICDEYPPNFLDASLLNSRPDGPAVNSADDPHFRQYRLVSTVYRLCAFLGWVELYRQDTTYLDTDDASGGRRVDQAIYAVRSDLADGQLNKARDWQRWHDVLVFREEQRAIGESMIVNVGGARTVMGYAEFCDLFTATSSSSRGQWLRTAATFLLDHRPIKDFRHTRMQRLIVHLVELVDVLSKARLRDDHWKAHERYKEVAVNPAV
jgi:hypothetical protein